MKRKPYRVIIIPALMTIAAAALLSFYITGVIDRSAALNVLDERLDSVCDAIDEKNTSLKDVNDELYKSFCSRARVISVLLSKNTETLTDETLFEEIRVAVGADSISVTDSTGIIVCSTDMSEQKTSALDEFMGAVGNKVFSDAVIYNTENSVKVVTGTSRLDAPGIIQIQFPLENYQQQLQLSGISSAVSQMPVMKHGHLAVVDIEENTYISHTDSNMNGSPAQFLPEQFSSDAGKFSSDYDGKKVIVKYKKHGDKVVLGMLPYSEIYQRRNTVVKWVLFSTAVVTVIIILALRNYIIRKKITAS